jgi:hypothetical protein
VLLEPDSISVVAAKILKSEPNNYALFSATSYKIIELTTFFSIILMIVATVYFFSDATCLCSKADPSSANLNKDYKKDYKNKLLKLPTRVLMGSLGISAIPTAISLMICVIYERLDLIKTQMSGTEIYIAFAGISIILISFLSGLLIEDEIEEDRIDKPEQTLELIEE